MIQPSCSSHRCTSYRCTSHRCTSYRHPSRQQAGAALIVALLIAALVAVLGTRIGNAYQLTFRRTSNVLLSDQANLFLLSAESIAEQLLLADDDTDKDYAGEPWGTEYPPVPIGQGMLAPQPMVDLRGRFNLNSLVEQYDNNQLKAQHKMFVRLLQTFPDIDMDRQRALAITAAVGDWLDADDQPRGFDGAESAHYAELEFPYRSADREMVSITELRLVKGMDAALYRMLAPHICALPENNVAINVNTATPNVLQALGADAADELMPLSKSEVDAYLEQIDPAVGMDKATFDGLSLGQTISSQAGAAGLYGEKSNYFAMHSYARLGELTLPMRSVLFRDGNADKVEVLSRSTGSL